MKKKIITLLAAFAFTFTTLGSTAFADYYSSYITLYQGMQNSEVKNLQNDLKGLGYFSFYPTGYFGSLTKQSVMQYQRDNNIAADGIVGHQTAKEIKVDKVLETANKYLGVPYVWGGVSPAGFDCSGFTHYVFLQNGIVLQRTSELQYEQGIAVSKEQLKPGDLVFFTTYKPGPSHVGIYLGNNQFIHESSGAGKVTISDLSKSYYLEHYIGAKRIIR
ncbi:MAG: NlpC/P60 family protein [Clostridia bacterium]|nr:NlpC/P60 family protein [Clostridia bacterium]